MSSVWFVMSDFALVLGEGFHVTEKDAQNRAAELTSSAGGEQSNTYSTVKVEDTQYEIHRDGLVPDAVWLLLEDGGVDPDFGYNVTRASALSLLVSRDVAAFEYWELSTEREEGMRLADYLLGRWSSFEIVRVVRHDMTGEMGEPSADAVRAKNLIRHDTDLPEPMTSVRGDLTTYTWEMRDEVVVEVRVNGETWESTVVHKPDARPMVSGRHSEDVILRARQALGVPGQVDLRLYAGPEWDSSDLDLDV